MESSSSVEIKVQFCQRQDDKGEFLFASVKNAMQGRTGDSDIRSDSKSGTCTTQIPRRDKKRDKTSEKHSYVS